MWFWRKLKNKAKDAFLPKHRPEEAETLGDPRQGIRDGNVPEEAVKESEKLHAQSGTPDRPTREPYDDGRGVYKGMRGEGVL